MQCEDRCRHACKHTPKHCCVSILTWPLVAGSSIPKLQSFSATQHVYWIDPHRRLNRCCTRAAFWCLHPFLKHFSPRNQRAADFQFPPVCERFSSRATVLVVLETNSKASFIETGLCNKALTHTICKCTHMQGGLTQGRPTWILGQETDSSRITPPPPHMNSLNIHRKKKTTQHIVPFPLWAPICGWLRNSKGVIRLSLYKHGARKKETGRRNGTDQVRNSSNSLQKDKEI